LAKSSYDFNKRQKELARKEKKEQKRQRKLDKKAMESDGSPNEPQDE
jgi:hypothetical protein